MKIIFLLALISSVSISASAKEYVGFDICSNFNPNAFSDYLLKTQNIKNIKKESSGNQTHYTFWQYKIAEKEYEVKITITDGVMHEIRIAPFLSKKSILKSELIKKYGYSGKKMINNNYLGNVRYEASYFNLNDPDVRLFTEKMTFKDGAVAQDESIKYECVRVSNKISEQKKKEELDLAAKRPKMTY